MTVKMNKATFRDLEHQASELGLGWMSDRDESYIYFTKWEWDVDDERGYDTTVRYTYTWSGTKLSVDKTSATAVLRDTSYVEDTTDVQKKLGVIEGMLHKLLDTNSNKDSSKTSELTTNVIKQFDPDKLQIIEPLYIAGGSVDAHGDAYKDPVEGPKKLVKAIKAGRKAKTLQSSLFHEHKTAAFEIIDEWVNEKDSVLEDGTEIPANLPLGLIKFHSEALYNARVEGRIGGLSMGAKGLVEVVSAEDYSTLESNLSLSETPLRVISDFIFTHKAAHYAYTSWDQGGAASKLNEPISIMKSKLKLSKNELVIIEEIGEEFTELDKRSKPSSTEETAPSTSTQEAQDAGVDKKTINKGQQMSVEQTPEYQEIVKKLAAMEIKEDLLPFNLEKSVASKAATAMAELSVEHREAIVKALTAIQEAGDTKVVELTAANADLNKSLASKEPTSNPIADLLKGEQGEGAGTPVVAAKPLSVIQQAAAQFNAKHSK